jgi:hypothetical protein
MGLRMCLVVEIKAKRSRGEREGVLLVLAGERERGTAVKRESCVGARIKWESNDPYGNQ